MAQTLQGRCESCMMPFKSDPLGADREHEAYCSYCYSDGSLTYNGSDVKEFKQGIVDAMVAQGSSRWKAKFYAFMAGFAPRWKK